MTQAGTAPPVALMALAAPFAGALWAAGTLFNPRLFNDPDTNWHLATGKLILRTGAIPRVDPFSWPAAGRPWIAHEWLSEVVMALAWQAGSWTGMALLTATALAIILCIFALRAGRCLAPRRAALAVIIIAAAVAPTTLIRPHVLAFVLLTTWTALLLDYRRNNRAPPWWSATLLMLWVNMHASWIMGIGIAGLLGLEALLRSRQRLQTFREWSIFGLVCVAATLANPHGFNAWIYPFDVNTMSSLHIIGEWRPMDVRKDPLHLATMAVVILGVARLHRQLGFIRIALIVGLMVMAVQHIRHLSPFALVSGLLLLDAMRDDMRPAGALGPRPISAVLATALVMLAALGVRLSVPLVRQDSVANPKTALAAVPPAIRALPVINFYDYGGALILNGIRPYVDGRADMYGDAHMLQYEQVLAGNASVFQQVVASGKVGWLLVHPDNRLRALAETAGWQRLYGDRFAVVLVRPDLAIAPAS